MKQPEFQRSLPARIFFVLVVVAAAGCAIAPGGGTKRELPAAYGDTLYATMKRDFAAGAFARAELSARELVQRIPDYPAVDEAYLIGARSAFSLGEYAQAATYGQTLGSRFPMSPYRSEALFLAAEAQRALVRPLDAARILSDLLDSPIDPDLQSRCMSALSTVADQLTAADLEQLVREHPSSPLAGEMSLDVAKREFARGNYDRAYTLLSELLYEFPQHKRAPEVRQLLKLAAARRDNPERTGGYVEPYKIGVLLPITGNFSRFGRLFEQGVTMAVEDFNAESAIPVTLVRADTKGDPVDAVTAVRKLILEEGVLAVVGSVFSVPSIAAAIECNAWKVPLLSPVVSEQRIDEIGTWVFQTKVPVEVEVSAMARLARDDLMIERFAVLAPDAPDKREVAELFMQEVRSRGGKIVATERYGVGDTDFREQLDRIRDAAPEALFIPGEPEELLNLLPQVSFYDMEIQLLGLSNWNSDKLLRLSQKDLEGALFPRETFYGKDRAAAEQFATRYKERYHADPHAVATAGYFGMRLILRAVAAGAVDRAQVRDFLTAELSASAAQRMAEASSLSILNVRSGKLLEFTASRRR